jgi:hypothetical protein
MHTYHSSGRTAVRPVKNAQLPFSFTLDKPAVIRESMPTGQQYGMRTPKKQTCPLCGRVTELSFHHFIPKKMHRRTYFRKNFTKEELSGGIMICRLCHDGIHDLYDEMELAKRFPSLQALAADPALKRHVRWVSRQK